MSVNGFQLTQNAAVKHRSNPAEKNGPVIRFVVVPEVWQTALEIAEENPRRIQILSDSECIVWNHEHWRTARD